MAVTMPGGVKSGRRGRRARTRPMSEINVTPFVDVMLVLLIIFMVAAPLLTAGVPLQLPETEARPLPAEQEPPLTLDLDADGKIFVQKREVEQERLIAVMTAVMAERTGKGIYLRADRSLNYERVMRVMGALSAAGFNQISLVTDTREAAAVQVEPAEN